MNLVEAIKSGKDFRRPGHPGYISCRPDHIGCSQHYWSFSEADLIADDWEVRSVEVDRKKLFQAFGLAWAKLRPAEITATDVATELAHLLGIG